MSLILMSLCVPLPEAELSKCICSVACYLKFFVVVIRKLANKMTFENMIVIKKVKSNKILLISFDGQKRYLIDEQKMKEAGLNLGSMCNVELENHVPKNLTKFKHPSGLVFEESKNVVEGKWTEAILKQENGSAFFESKLFGRVACVDKKISLSELDKSHFIKISLISLEAKVGGNSICHWEARIDHTPKPSKPIKVEAQCCGVITKIGVKDNGLKYYFCWLTDEHASSIVFDTPKKQMNLQRGDFFQANFEKTNTDPKWMFVSFIKRIEPLTTTSLYNGTISLTVRLQNIKHVDNTVFLFRTEAYHPLVGNIIDNRNVLKPSDSNGIEVKVIIHQLDGLSCWVILED